MVPQNPTVIIIIMVIVIVILILVLILVIVITIIVIIIVIVPFRFFLIVGERINRPLSSVFIVRRAHPVLLVIWGVRDGNLPSIQCSLDELAQSHRKLRSCLHLGTSPHRKCLGDVWHQKGSFAVDVRSCYQELPYQLVARRYVDASVSLACARPLECLKTIWLHNFNMPVLYTHPNFKSQALNPQF